MCESTDSYNFSISTQNRDRHMVSPPPPKKKNVEVEISQDWMFTHFGMQPLTLTKKGVGKMIAVFLLLIFARGKERAIYIYILYIERERERNRKIWRVHGQNFTF